MDYLTAKVEKNEETTNFLCFFLILLMLQLAKKMTNFANE